jgi:hypothetical protein
MQSIALTRSCNNLICRLCFSKIYKYINIKISSIQSDACLATSMLSRTSLLKSSIWIVKVFIRLANVTSTKTKKAIEQFRNSGKNYECYNMIKYKLCISFLFQINCEQFSVPGCHSTLRETWLANTYHTLITYFDMFYNESQQDLFSPRNYRSSSSRKYIMVWVL